MRKPVGIFLVATGLLMYLNGSAYADVAWSHSLGQAMAKAKATRKLVMIDFYTDWCGWCKRMDAGTYTDGAVTRATSQVVPVKVNAEKEGLTAARRYHVSSFPTILFINSAGEVEGKIGGYEDAPTFVNHLGSIMTFHKEVLALPATEMKFRRRPDLPQATKLLGLYVTLGREQKAVGALSTLRALDPTDSKGYLTRSTLFVAEMYRNANQPDRAIDLFQTALRTAKRPEEKGIAHISLAFCQLARHDGKGRPLFSRAIPELKAVIAVPGAPDELKQQAQQMLGQIDAYRRQHPGA